MPERAGREGGTLCVPPPDLNDDATACIGLESPTAASTATDTKVLVACQLGAPNERERGPTHKRAAITGEVAASGEQQPLKASVSATSDLVFRSIGERHEEEEAEEEQVETPRADAEAGADKVAERSSVESATSPATGSVSALPLGILARDPCLNSATWRRARELSLSGLSSCSTSPFASRGASVLRRGGDRMQASWSSSDITARTKAAVIVQRRWRVYSLCLQRAHLLGSATGLDGGDTKIDDEEDDMSLDSRSTVFPDDEEDDDGSAQPDGQQEEEAVERYQAAEPSRLGVVGRIFGLFGFLRPAVPVESVVSAELSALSHCTDESSWGAVEDELSSEKRDSEGEEEDEGEELVLEEVDSLSLIAALEGAEGEAETDSIEGQNDDDGGAPPTQPGGDDQPAGDDDQSMGENQSQQGGGQQAGGGPGDDGDGSDSDSFDEDDDEEDDDDAATQEGDEDDDDEEEDDDDDDEGEDTDDKEEDDAADEEDDDDAADEEEEGGERAVREAEVGVVEMPPGQLGPMWRVRYTEDAPFLSGAAVEVVHAPDDAEADTAALPDAAAEPASPVARNEASGGADSPLTPVPEADAQAEAVGMAASSEDEPPSPSPPTAPPVLEAPMISESRVQPVDHQQPQEDAPLPPASDDVATAPVAEPLSAQAEPSTSSVTDKQSSAEAAEPAPAPPALDHGEGQEGDEPQVSVPGSSSPILHPTDLPVRAVSPGALHTAAVEEEAGDEEEDEEGEPEEDTEDDGDSESLASTAEPADDDVSAHGANMSIRSFESSDEEVEPARQGVGRHLVRVVGGGLRFLFGAGAFTQRNGESWGVGEEAEGDDASLAESLEGGESLRSSASLADSEGGDSTASLAGSAAVDDDDESSLEGEDDDNVPLPAVSEEPGQAGIPTAANGLSPSPVPVPVAEEASEVEPSMAAREPAGTAAGRDAVAASPVTLWEGGAALVPDQAGEPGQHHHATVPVLAAQQPCSAVPVLHGSDAPPAEEESAVPAPLWQGMLGAGFGSFLGGGGGDFSLIQPPTTSPGGGSRFQRLFQGRTGAAEEEDEGEEDEGAGALSSEAFGFSSLAQSQALLMRSPDAEDVAGQVDLSFLQQAAEDAEHHAGEDFPGASRVLDMLLTDEEEEATAAPEEQPKAIERAASTLLSAVHAASSPAVEQVAAESESASSSITLVAAAPVEPQAPALSFQAQPPVTTAAAPTSSPVRGKKVVVLKGATGEASTAQPRAAVQSSEAPATKEPSPVKAAAASKSGEGKKESSSSKSPARAAKAPSREEEEGLAVAKSADSPVKNDAGSKEAKSPSRPSKKDSSPARSSKLEAEEEDPCAAALRRVDEMLAASEERAAADRRAARAKGSPERASKSRPTSGRRRKLRVSPNTMPEELVEAAESIDADVWDRWNTMSDDSGRSSATSSSSYIVGCSPPALMDELLAPVIKQQHEEEDDDDDQPVEAETPAQDVVKTEEAAPAADEEQLEAATEGSEGSGSEGSGSDRSSPRDYEKSRGDSLLSVQSADEDVLGRAVSEAVFVDAVCRVQGLWRGALARKVSARLRVACTSRQRRQEAVTAIQRLARRHWAYRKAKAFISAMLETRSALDKLQQEREAAEKLQAWARGRMAVRRYQCLVQHHRSGLKVAGAMQRMWRGRVSRRASQVLLAKARLLKTWCVAYHRGRMCRRRYLGIRAAVCIVQLRFRHKRRRREAAIRLQASVRGFVKQSKWRRVQIMVLYMQRLLRVRLNRRRRVQCQAATKLQAQARAIIQRRAFLSLRTRRATQALLIQRAWRRWRCLSQYRKLRDGVIRLQALARQRSAASKFRADVRLIVMLQQRVRRNQQRQHAAITLQRVVRGHAARVDLALHNAAAMKLQAVLLLFLTRKWATEGRAAWRDAHRWTGVFRSRRDSNPIVRAMVEVQAAFRMRRAARLLILYRFLRKALGDARVRLARKKARHNQLRCAAAIMIQCKARCRAARKAAAQKRCALIVAQKMVSTTLVMQRCWRGHQGRRIARARRQELQEAAHQKEREDAALLLQSVRRGLLARRELAVLRTLAAAAAKHKAEEDARIKLRSIVRIQRCIRAYRFRRSLRYRLVLGVVCNYERLQGDRFARAVLLLQRIWRARRQARLQVEQAATTATQADGAAVEEEAEARVISITTRAPLQASAPAANVAQDKAADEPSRLPGRLWGAHRRVMTWSIGLSRTSSSRRREEAAEPAPPVAAPTPAVASEAETSNNQVEPVDSSPAQHERAASSSSASSSSSDSKAAKTSADSKFPQLLGLLRRKRATVQSQQPQAAAAAQGSSSQVAEATQTAEDAAPTAADVAELEQLAKEAALADVLLLEKEVDEAAAEAINAMDEDDMLLLQELGGSDKVEEEREVLATVQEDDEEDEDEEVAMEQAGDHSLGLKEPELEHRPRQERTRSGRLIKWLRRKQSDRDLAAASAGAATVGEPVPAGEGEAEGEAAPQVAGGRQPSYWSFEGLVNGRVKRSESMGVNKARELDAQEPAQEGGDKQLVRRSPLRRSTREDAGLAREHVPEEGGGVEQEEEGEEEADDNASFYSSYSHAHSSPDKGATHRSRNSSQASTLTADMDGSGSSSNAVRQSWWPLSRGSRSWSFQRQSSKPEVEGEQDGKARGLESGGRHRQRQQLAQSSDHQAALDGSSGPRARAVSLQVVQETLPATALSPNPELLVLPRRGSIAPSAPPAPGQGHAAKDSMDNSNQASYLSPNPELLTLVPDKEGDKSQKNRKQAIRHVHSSVQTDEEGPEPQHGRAHRSNSSELPPTHLLPNPELLDLRPSAAPHGKADKHVRNAHTSTREAGDDEEDEEGGGQQEAGLSPNPELLVLSHLDHVPSRRRASRRDSSASFDEHGLLQFRKPGPLATVVSGDGSEEAAAEETGASVDSNGLLDLRKHGEEEEEGVMPGPLDIPPSCLPFNLLGLLSTQTPESSRPPHRRGSEAGSEMGAGPRSALSGSSAMEIGSVRIPPNKGNKAGSVGSAQGPAGKPQRAAKVMDKLTDFLLPTGPSAPRTDPAAIRTASVPSQQPKARTGEQPVVPATRGGKVRRKDGGEQVRRPDRTKPLQPRNYNYDVDPRAMRRQTVLSARELERLDATNAYISDVWGKNARRLSKDVEDSHEYREMLRQQRRQERGGMNRLTPVTSSSAGRRRRKQFFEPDGEYEELLREAAEVVEAHNGRREARAMAHQQQQHYAPTATSRRSSGGTAPTAGSSSAKRSRASPSPHCFTPVPSPGPPPMLGTYIPSPAPAPFTATDPVVQQHRRQRSSGSTGTAVMYTAPVLGYGGGSGGTSLTVPRVRQQDMQPLTSAAEHARARSMQSEDGVAWGQVIVDEYAHSIGMGQESGGVRELIDNMMSAPTDRAAQATGMSMLRYYSREPGACRELCRREGLRAISDAMRYHFSENTILEDAVEILTRLTTQSPEMRSRVKAGLPAYTQDLLVHAKSKFMPKSRASQACDQLLRLLRPSSISN